MNVNLRTIVAVLLVGGLTPKAWSQTEVDVHLQPSPEAMTAQQSEEFSKAVFFGEKFFQLDDLDSALGQFQKASEIFPDHPTILYDLAVIYAKKGQYAEAQSRIDRYAAVYPTGEELPMIQKLQLELDFLRELERKQQADQAFAELFNRGKFQFERGNYQQALEIFQQAEKQRSDDPAVFYNEALTYEALGDYIKATDRLRRYQAISPGGTDKIEIDRKIFTLESEVEDMRTKILCPFCGYKLVAGATWCPHCWRGPYMQKSAIWSSRICGAGATATRTTMFNDGRLHQNEDLPCLIRDKNFAETLRYSKARQRAIQNARRAEGWTYSGDILQSFTGSDGSELTLLQDGSLHQLQSSAGDILDYQGHQTDDGRWLLDYEEYVIDGQRYAKNYSYDETGRVLREVVDYYNTNACGHLITVTADYLWEGERLGQVVFAGSYRGYQAEGTPETQWTSVLTYTYDDIGRVVTEDFAVTSFGKTYTTDTPRDVYGEIRRMHPQMRTRKALDLLSSSDYCSVVGTSLVSNQIDLRPFYTISPNIAILLPSGVTKMTTSFNYPQGFSLD